MSQSCEKHAALPVVGHSPCAGCEIERLKAENERYRKYGCDTCDGSGHLHRADGEYFGECKSCGAYELEQAKREAEGLRKDAELYRFVSQLAWYVDRAAYIYNVGNQRAAWSDDRRSVDADEIEDAIVAAMTKDPLANPGQ
jgi:hypothetical protein